MFCASCGTKNESPSKFCQSCGQPMPAAEPAAASQTALLPTKKWRNPLVITAIAVAVIIVIGLFMRGGDSSKIAYKGVSIGTKVDQVQKKLGKPDRTDNSGPQNTEVYNYSNEVEVAIKDKAVVGLYMVSSGAKTDNGFKIGTTTVKDVIDKLGEKHLKNFDSLHGFMYVDKKNAIIFQVDGFSKDIYENDTLRGITSITVDLAKDAGGKDFENAFNGSSKFTYKKGSSK